ncbi:MAG: hypothetical protein ACJ763_10835 [Bdellovibrionia bacterium]
MRIHSLLIGIALLGIQPAFADICSKVSENQAAQLTCPSGQTMSSISFASYGTPSGSCGSYAVSSCNSSSSKSVVQSACVGKASCQVSASNSIFGDPCSGVGKTLAVQAVCSAPSTSSACGSAAENQAVQVSCPSGQVISSISFASYGTPTGSCGSFAVSSCNASTSKSVVQSACVGKASCQVSASNSVFGDPCSGIAKKLAVQVACSASASPSPSPSPSSAPKPSPSPSPSPSPAPTASTSARDPLKQPFASNSIWNMPIGSGAVFAPANLSATPGNNIWAPMPGADDEFIFMTPTAPLTDVNYSSAGWSGANRCGATGGLYGSVPMPSNYIVPNGNGNNGTAALLPDKRTIVQFQPLARCTSGGPATTYTRFLNVDLYGDGLRGMHGGSGLSSIGGSIRVGELRPGQQGMRHALKINVYATEALYRCTSSSNCYRWPAVTGDSYAVGYYGAASNNQNTQMKMGALLAIPPSVNLSSLGLETDPGRQIAWTLQNYGGYIVDDTYAAGFFFSTEAGPAGRKVDEFQNDYGYAFLQRVTSASTSPWLRDIQRIVKALQVVSNNSATSIGGGGTPRQPLAPAIAP